MLFLAIYRGNQYLELLDIRGPPCGGFKYLLFSPQMLAEMIQVALSIVLRWVEIIKYSRFVFSTWKVWMNFQCTMVVWVFHKGTF